MTKLVALPPEGPCTWIQDGNLYKMIGPNGLVEGSVSPYGSRWLPRYGESHLPPTDDLFKAKLKVSRCRAAARGAL